MSQPTDRLFDWGLAGQRALVTGASGGLGAAFSSYLAQAGATVILAARNLKRVEALAAQINDAGGSAAAVEMDMRLVGSMQAAVEKVESEIGAIDVLVNNAAIAPLDNALNQDVSSWDEIQATNLRGPWYLSTEVARRMRDSDRHGAIVNIASTAGLSPSPYMAGYGASKAALIQLTGSLAAEFAAFGIRINAIAPGIVEAGMAAGFVSTPSGRAILKRVPLGRFGRPEDFRCALLWLCSGHSSFVTGSCVVIDGGLSGVGA